MRGKGPGSVGGEAIHPVFVRRRRRRIPRTGDLRLSADGYPIGAASSSSVQILDVRERPVVVIRGSGQRAAVGASLLQRFGADHVMHVIDGGVPAWRRAGHELEQPQSVS